MSYVLFWVSCFAAGFGSTAAARAKNSNSLMSGTFFGGIADLAWLIVFKDFIADNVLGIVGTQFYVLYVTGYGAGRVSAQYVTMKFLKGKASVGGVKTLEQRIEVLEQKYGVMYERA